MDKITYSRFKESLNGLRSDMEATKDAHLKGQDISTHLFQIHQRYEIPLSDLQSIDFTA